MQRLNRKKTQTVCHFPEIDGFNLEEGLARIGGNLERFTKVIKKFSLKQKDAPERILKSIESNNLSEARITAHTLSGVAGNIGAIHLSKAAQALEKAIAQGENDKFKSLLKVLENRFQEFFSAIDQIIMPGSSEENESYINLSPALLFNEIQKVADLLSMQLRQGDSEASETITKLKKLIFDQNMPEPPEIIEAEAFIDCYEFEEALSKITAFKYRISKFNE